MTPSKISHLFSEGNGDQRDDAAHRPLPVPQALPLLQGGARPPRLQAARQRRLRGRRAQRARGRQRRGRRRLGGRRRRERQSPPAGLQLHGTFQGEGKEYKFPRLELSAFISSSLRFPEKLFRSATRLSSFSHSLFFSAAQVQLAPGRAPRSGRRVPHAAGRGRVLPRPPAPRLLRGALRHRRQTDGGLLQVRLRRQAEK